MSADVPRRGALVVVAAPSGAGKTTLVHALLERLPDVEFSVSHTTRAPRATERPGKDYFFVDDEQFDDMIAAGEFLEHALVFDQRYGTSRSAVEALRARGSTVLLEIDWQGAEQVRRAAPDAITIFILPPSVAELERRLRGRKTDSDATISRRLRDSLSDMSHWKEFDYVIINDDLEAAAQALVDVVKGHGEPYRGTAPGMGSRIEALLAGSHRLQ